MKKSFMISHLCAAMLCVLAFCSCSSKEEKEEFFLKNFCQLAGFPPLTGGVKSCSAEGTNKSTIC